jgi:hypothetical protein
VDTRIDENLIRLFVDLGKQENFETLMDLWNSGTIDRHGDLMRLLPRPWYDIAATLPDDDDVIALIKTLTIAERMLHGWKAGSVSPVIWLFRALSERSQDKDDGVLVQWIRSHSDNPYLPFGSLRR